MIYGQRTHGLRFVLHATNIRGDMTNLMNPWIDWLMCRKPSETLDPDASFLTVAASLGKVRIVVTVNGADVGSVVINELPRSFNLGARVERHGEA